jgi:DNA-binding response OmpR family regulator
MRVLLIEDEPTTAKSIELMLGTEGFNVYTTDLGEEGLDLGKLYDYDIILLDLNLPDMHGYDVLKKLRTAKVSTPVLILSGIGEMDSKVRALGFGADDYVTKPFHRDELVARIHAIVRRSKGHSQSVIRTGKLAVNLDAKTVEVDGARAQDHRRVHLQAAQEAEPCLRRRQLHRDRLGPRLCATRCRGQRTDAAASRGRLNPQQGQRGEGGALSRPAFLFARS